jgi:hypothetical protein
MLLSQTLTVKRDLDRQRGDTLGVGCADKAATDRLGWALKRWDINRDY